MDPLNDPKGEPEKEEKLDDSTELDDLKGAEPDDPKGEKEPEGKQKEEKRYTDDEVNAIVSRALAKEKRRVEKAQSEAAKLAGMNEDEKAEYERRQLERRVEELQREKDRMEMKVEARKMLIEKGLSGISDDLIEQVVADDAEETKLKVTNFAQLMKAEIDKGVTEALKREPPKRGSGENKPTYSEAKKRADEYNNRFKKKKEK